MPRTSVIKQDGTGNYTSIGAWESSIDITTNGLETGEIQDSNTYSEAVTFSGFTGTPSSTEYAYLTVASANRHGGVVGTGAAVHAGAGSHVFTNSENFTRIEYLDVHQTGTGTSDECFRCTADTLISRCLIISDNGSSQQDGVYTATASVTINIDHCIIGGFASRGGVHAQTSSGMVFNIDHCTIMGCDTAVAASASGAPTFNVYNTIGETISAADAFMPDYAGTGSGTFAGDRNIADDNSAEAQFTNSYDSVTFTNSASTPASGEHAWFEDYTNGDYRLYDTNAFTVTQNGQTRTAPDTRQDFTIDIADVSWGSNEQIGANVPTQLVGGTPTATVTVTNLSGTTLPNETGISWTWRDSFGGAVTDSGSAETTDGSGVMVVELPNTGLASGQSGYLTIQLSDGTEGVAKDLID